MLTLLIGHCDLFRHLVAGWQDNPSQILSGVPDGYLRHCESRCVTHAFSVVEIFTKIMDFNAERMLAHTHFAIIAYQCSNILARSKRVAGSPPAREAMAGMHVCLLITTKLAHSTFAKLVEHEIQSLIEQGETLAAMFPQNCAGSADDNYEYDTANGWSATQQPWFSRHNIVKAAEIHDQGDELDLERLPPDNMGSQGVPSRMRRRSMRPQHSTCDWEVSSSGTFSGNTDNMRLSAHLPRREEHHQRTLPSPASLAFAVDGTVPSTGAVMSSGSNEMVWEVPDGFSDLLLDLQEPDCLFDPFWDAGHDWDRMEQL
jgi:hypothetical protein